MDTVDAKPYDIERKPDKEKPLPKHLKFLTAAVIFYGNIAFVSLAHNAKNLYLNLYFYFEIYKQKQYILKQFFRVVPSTLTAHP